MGQNDIVIAATALSLGNTTVIRMDTALVAIPRLTVENSADASVERAGTNDPDSTDE